MTITFLPPIIFSLIAPVFLIFIEKPFPYPHLIEEAAKAAIVLNISKVTRLRNKLALAVILGLCFALSESILWWGSFFDGGLGLFVRRLILTAALHVATYAILIISITRSKKGMILGLVAAVVVHYFFNLWGIQVLLPFN